MQITTCVSTSVRWIMILSLLVQTAAAARGNGETRATNVRYGMANGKVQVHYDILAPADSVLQVSLLLRKESDRSFSYAPKQVSGDVGKGRFAGPGRTIEWEITKEFPQGLAGNDYYFEVVIGAPGVPGPREEAGGGNNLLTWIGAGAAVLGVGLFAVLRSSSGDESPPVAPPAGFPAPPGRP